MREQVVNWKKQGKMEIESAERALTSGDFYLVAYLSHQAVEKLLKALILHRSHQPPPYTHSLIRLGKDAKVPRKFENSLRDLTPHYVLSRYPDASGEVPYELYDQRKAEAILRDAKEVISWIEKQIGS